MASEAPLMAVPGNMHIHRCQGNREFPLPEPTGSFYQRRYFNPNLKVFGKVFHKDSLFHIYLRLIIVTHNKFFGTFVM